MRVFVTGGTGLIGRRLVRRLIDRGDQAVVLSRRQGDAWAMPELRGAEVVAGDPSADDAWAGRLDGSDAVVNLVGHSVFGARWNVEVKRKIRDSRVYGTQHVVSAIRKARARPGVLVQGSAIGYYGPRGDEELTEDASLGTDFLAHVCREWEDAAHPAEALGLRVARVRIGVVLARDGGALATLTPVFRWGSGAPVGSGRQWVSWIHVEDIVGLLLLALDHPDARGPINGTAPHPERNADFSKALAQALHRPLLPIGPPAMMLRLMLGESAEVVTTGQRVIPARALALGYSYRFPDLAGALADLFARPKGAASPVPTPAAAGPGH